MSDKKLKAFSIKQLKALSAEEPKVISKDKALSIVRREEENNVRDLKAEALDHQANAVLPGNNDAVDRCEDSLRNAANLAKVGATYGYTAKGKRNDDK
jgi:hypothetical protein